MGVYSMSGSRNTPLCGQLIISIPLSLPSFISGLSNGHFKDNSKQSPNYVYLFFLKKASQIYTLQYGMGSVQVVNIYFSKKRLVKGLPLVVSIPWKVLQNQYNTDECCDILLNP